MQQSKLYSIHNLEKTFCVIVRENVSDFDVSLYSIKHHTDVYMPVLGVKKFLDGKGKLHEDVVSFSIKEIDDGVIPVGKFHNLTIAFNL